MPMYWPRQGARWSCWSRCVAGRPCTATQDLLADEPRRKTMAQAMANMGIPQAGEKIYETLLTLVNP